MAADRQDGTGVAVGAADGAGAAAAFTLALPDRPEGHRHVGADAAAEGVGIELEAGVAGQHDTNVARVRGEFVAAALGQRRVEFDVARYRPGLEALDMR